MKLKLEYSITALLLCIIYCTKDTVFNPTDIQGITIAAYACDSTGLDTTITQFDSTLSIDSALAGQTITFLGFIKGDSASVKHRTWKWEFEEDNGRDYFYVTEPNYCKRFVF